MITSDSNDGDSDGIEDQWVLDFIFDGHQDSSSVRHRHGGSTQGRRVINRDIRGGGQRLYQDYFGSHPVYSSRLFRRRFRMRRSLFLRILTRLKRNSTSYFHQKRDALGHAGLTDLQKMTAALRQLAYGVAADATDEYVRIGESTASLCLKHFCREVIEVFGPEYLRKPTETTSKEL